MKKFIYKTLALATLVSVASCSDSDEIADNPNNNAADHEMISFSLSDGTGTRAGFTGADTRIVARIQANEKGGTGVKYTCTYFKASKDGTNDATSYSVVEYYTPDNTRYWDDAFGRKSLLSVFAVAIPNSTDDNKLADGILAGNATWSTTASNNTINWDVTTTEQTAQILNAEDLVFSNNIQADATLGKNGVYRYDFATNKYMPRTNDATEGTGSADHKNGQMLFFQQDMSTATDLTSSANAPITDAPGKFDKGHMVFTHALSRLTVYIKKGAGFTTDNPFAFASDGNGGTTNITLHNMNIKGSLDLPSGIWTIASDGSGTGNIGKMAETTKPEGVNYAFTAQMLPNYIFYSTGDNANKNVMSFTIDNNTYYITQANIHKALQDNAATNNLNTSATSYTMEKGKNYILTITVGKTQINNITATLADFVKVEAANQTPSNSRITLALKNTEGTACESFDLYRLPQTRGTGDDELSFAGNIWEGNYTDYVTTKSGASTDKQMAKATNYDTTKLWSTPWFFENNLTYYHFRTVNQGTTIVGATGDAAATTDDYFVISSGAQVDHDFHWGAPMKSGANYTYNETANSGTGKTEGYASSLNPAIGSTESTIAIQEFHMMSNINIILKTPSTTVDGVTKPASNAVEFTKTTDGTTEYTTVELTNYFAKGTVKMGTGFVTATTTEARTSATITAPATDAYWTTNKLETKPYTWAVVPQLVKDGDARIGITITTPDGNKYYVNNLDEIKVSTIGTATYKKHNVDDEIKRWFPGHSYTYTFTLTKKGIESITCTLADWIPVASADIPIDLEK